MRPPFWHPSVELSFIEQTIITRIKRAKLFVFLRYHRHELFDDAFQEKLVTLYAPSLRGHPPIPPAQLALATIGASRTRVFRIMKSGAATLMDRRWQLVLDCLDTEQAPFSTGGTIIEKYPLTLISTPPRLALLLQPHLEMRELQWLIFTVELLLTTGPEKLSFPDCSRLNAAVVVAQSRTALAPHLNRRRCALFATSDSSEALRRATCVQRV